MIIEHLLKQKLVLGASKATNFHGANCQQMEAHLHYFAASSYAYHALFLSRCKEYGNVVAYWDDEAERKCRGIFMRLRKDKTGEHIFSSRTSGPCA
ncbi:hypothetical protein V6N12_014668 [Hibiscus sabdariffa]|uniref:Uncharacterized protein n=1 Tax=Hibiscus sabdariffa TaxID=183260 RepID=A0ABR2DKV3_9ROSI